MYDFKISGDIKPLLSKIKNVMKEVDNIPKNGINQSIGYNYVMEKDVVEKLRNKLIDMGIVILPSVVETKEREITLSNNKSTFISKVIMSFTFFDTDSGSSITIYGSGEGQDSLDKGIYKAITGCQKYVLLKTFLIPTGDDPECDPKNIHGEGKNNSQQGSKEPNRNLQNNRGPEDVIPANIAKELYKAGLQKGNLNSVLKKYGYKTTYDVRYKHLNNIKKELSL